MASSFPIGSRRVVGRRAAARQWARGERLHHKAPMGVFCHLRPKRRIADDAGVSVCVRTEPRRGVGLAASSIARPAETNRLVTPGWTSLKSRVGRRLLLLFVSCAVVPLVVALYLSFSHVTDQLYEQSENRLQHDSKAVGMAVLRELLSLSSEVERVAAEAGDATPHSLDPARERDGRSVPLA